ncbi:mandelate racemase [Microbacterium protaetiae]|uniref:Mandelate racemase n=1 Tax=Microbacterium protaetiae TaxID=2509458 RepID=A0A4P6ECM9_9MICO|nr:enolase C-terminal domain-like protein [Microbacterium protaetiae]QAY59995.1 mandelate racemase [Microbacterium protaetiae]
MMDPQIDCLDVHAYTVPTDEPEADGTIAWDSTTMVLVQAHAGGVVGTGWTYGAAQCRAVIGSTLAPLVVGHSALETGRCFQSMVHAVRNSGRQGAIGYAISAVDTALWDLKARLLEVPLYRLLGAVRDTVPVYGSGGFTTYSDRRLAEQLGGWVHDEGIPRVKIKIGQSWGTEVRRDLQRMRQAREVIGPTAELYVDANGAYARKQAIRLAHAAADLDVRWFEEPVSSDDLAGLREVRNAIDADVAAGEYGFDLVYFRRMCQAQAVDCLQIDASRCGGITEWLRGAAVAASYGLDVSAHCSPHLHAHVAAATPNLRHLEWFHDHVRIETLFFDGVLDPRGGMLVLDGTAPGTGLTLRENDVARFRVS